MSIPNKHIIFIMDDHPIVRAGIKFLLKEHFDCDVYEVADETTLLRLSKVCPPSIVLLDINMPGENPLQAMSNLLSVMPDVAFIIVSMNKEEVYAPLYLKYGARGYIHKNADNTEFIRAITSVLSGGIYIKRKLKYLFMENVPDRSPYGILAKKEIEILSALVSGSSLTAISRNMNLSPSTISTYKARILHKLKLTNVIELNEFTQLYPIK